MFDLIGLDWGSKYFGIAFASTQNKIVIPANQQINKKNLFAFLKEQIQAKNIQTIVLGYPSNFQQQPTKISQQVEKFAQKLQKFFPQQKVILVNENSSSKLAKILDPKNIHNQAAARILEFYLEFKRK